LILSGSHALIRRPGGDTVFSEFKYGSLPLHTIQLDDRNPRIVTQAKLSSQDEILKYLYDYENLRGFISKIAAESKNVGAERPYVVKAGTAYVVVEGNTRIAAYKILTGLLTPPNDYQGTVPDISDELRNSLLMVDCSIAPSRDALLPIMANAHFGLGDKSKWGYLGSRKAVYDEWKAGKSAPELAVAFDRTEPQIRELILEYDLYLTSLGLQWSKKDKAALLHPAVKFNPPVRFLESSGHKAKVGISYDTASLKVVLKGAKPRKKLKHLIQKLVIKPVKGLGATASYEAVFKDFDATAPQTGVTSGGGSGTVEGSGSTTGGGSTGSAQSTGATSSGQKFTLKPGALFAYPVTLSNALISHLMKEAAEGNWTKLPAAGTFLLRNIVESILKEVIDSQKANPASHTLDLEKALNLCGGPSVALPKEDKKILKLFQKNYLNYLNLGAHGNIIPNAGMLFGARDCIDQFIKRNV
jgi:hypothetical protein